MKTFEFNKIIYANRNIVVLDYSKRFFCLFFSLWASLSKFKKRDFIEGRGLLLFKTSLPHRIINAHSPVNFDNVENATL